MNNSCVIQESINNTFFYLSLPQNEVRTPIKTT